MRRILSLVTAIALIFTVMTTVTAQEPVYKSHEVTVYVNDKEYRLCGYDLPSGDPYGIKLRDIAVLFNGTSKQFNVGFENGTVTVVPGQPYTPLGTELQKFDGTVKEGAYSTHIFQMMGEYIGIEATLAEDYNYVSLVSFAYIFSVVPVVNEDGSITINTEVQPEMEWG